jgi:SAM-dependent methyltransferase
MNRLAPILAPVFVWNHNQVMLEGGVSHGTLGVALTGFETHKRCPAADPDCGAIGAVESGTIDDERTPDDSWNKATPTRIRRALEPSRCRQFLAWLACRRCAGRRRVRTGADAAISELSARERSESSLRKAFREGPRTSGGRNPFHVANALAMPEPESSVDVVVSGLVLNFIADAVAALAEMKRLARVGGTVAAYVWDYAGRMELMRHFWDAAVELNPDAHTLDEGARFPLCKPRPLEDAFRTAGLAAVEVVPIEIGTRFHDFGDYWTPFLGGQGPAPSYPMSLDEAVAQHGALIASERLPISPMDRFRSSLGRGPCEAGAWQSGVMMSAAGLPRRREAPRTEA